MDKLKQLADDLRTLMQKNSKYHCVDCRNCPFAEKTDDRYDSYKCSKGKCVIRQAADVIESLSSM